MEQAFRQRVGHTVTDVAEQMNEAQEILTTDAIFRQLVVQRSRQLRTGEPDPRDRRGYGVPRT